MLVRQYSNRYSVQKYHRVTSCPSVLQRKLGDSVIVFQTRNIMQLPLVRPQMLGDLRSKVA